MPCVLTESGCKPAIVGMAGTNVPSVPCTSTRRSTLPVAVELSSFWSKRKLKRSVAPAASVLLIVVPANWAAPPRSR